MVREMNIDLVFFFENSDTRSKVQRIEKLFFASCEIRAIFLKLYGQSLRMDTLVLRDCASIYENNEESRNFDLTFFHFSV